MSKTTRESVEAIYLKRLPNPETGLYDIKSSIDDLCNFIADRERLAVLRELDTIEALDDPEKIPDNYAALSAIEDYIRTRQNQLLTGVAELSTEGSLDGEA